MTTFNLDSLTRFLQSLIQLQTLSGEEQPVIERVAAEMPRMGYDRVWTDANGSMIGLTWKFPADHPLVQAALTGLL
jgi:putative aminopeptidase FrvX